MGVVALDLEFANNRAAPTFDPFTLEWVVTVCKQLFCIPPFGGRIPPRLSIFRLHVRFCLPPPFPDIFVEEEETNVHVTVVKRGREKERDRRRVFVGTV